MLSSLPALTALAILGAEPAPAAADHAPPPIEGACVRFDPAPDPLTPVDRAVLQSALEEALRRGGLTLTEACPDPWMVRHARHPKGLYVALVSRDGEASAIASGLGELPATYQALVFAIQRGETMTAAPPSAAPATAPAPSAAPTTAPAPSAAPTTAPAPSGAPAPNRAPVVPGARTPPVSMLPPEILAPVKLGRVSYFYLSLGVAHMNDLGDDAVGETGFGYRYGVDHWGVDFSLTATTLIEGDDEQFVEAFHSSTRIQAIYLLHPELPGSSYAQAGLGFGLANETETFFFDSRQGNGWEGHLGVGYEFMRDRRVRLFTELSLTLPFYGLTFDGGSEAFHTSGSSFGPIVSFALGVGFGRPRYQAWRR